MLVRKTIRKHVSIIHAYSLMTVLQRKIVNVLLYETFKNQDQLNYSNSVSIEYCMPLSSVIKAVNFNSNNTQYLKSAIDGLASILIEWNLLKDKAPLGISFLNLRVLHGAPTFYKDNTFNFSFHKLMLELVNNPLIYGTVDIDLQSKFESKYSHSLYENSTRFVNLQKKKIVQLDIFRKLLGIQEDKYLSMREISRNVIKPALEEVNDRANFIVKLDRVTTGKKIIGFELEVTEKENKTTSKSVNKDNENKLRQKIKSTFGNITEKTMLNIINSHTEEYIYEKINYTKEHAKESNTGIYPIAYFISALNYDYKKSIDVHPEIPNEKKIDDNDMSLYQLTLDLNHWNKMLEYAKVNNKIQEIENIKTIIQQCQDKIRNYHIEKPNEEEAG